MVTAIVGANWGDEGKGKITDMLGEEYVFKVEVMQVILSSITMANSHYICFRQAFSMIIQQVLSEMVLH